MPEGPTYDVIVSLGRHCQPAHQIRRFLGYAPSNVFDWIVTTDDGLVQLISSGLEGFFSIDLLGRNADGVVLDALTGTKFFHGFPSGVGIAEGHRRQAARMAGQALRWRALMASSAQVLFVRQHGARPDVRRTAVRLRDTLRTAAPGIGFTLLYLTDPEAAEPDWGEPQIRNRPLAQPEPYRWQGLDAAWTRVLAEALVHCPPPAERTLGAAAAAVTAARP